jgi:hypothetical protein
MSAIHKQMTNAEYHADRTADSWTTIKVFDANPLDYHDYYVTGTRRFKPTPDVIRGAMAHTLVADEEPWWIVIPSSIKQRRGKTWLSFKADYPDKREDEFVPAQYLADAVAMREGLFANPACKTLLETAASVEESIYWIDPVTKLPLKMRMDAGGLDYLVDMKFTCAPTPKEFPSQLHRQRWYRQAAHYSVGFKAAYESKPTFFFIATRNEPPWDSYVHKVNPTAIREGIACNRDTLARLAKAKATGQYVPEGWGVINDLDLRYFDYQHMYQGDGA